MAFDVMKRENRAITRRQLRDGLIQGYPVHDRHGIRIFGAFNDLYRRFAVFRGLLEPHAALAKMHEYLVYSQSMQPGGKGRLSAKAADLAKQLDKDFLCQIFGLDDISSHAQAERIYSAV